MANSVDPDQMDLHCFLPILVQQGNGKPWKKDSW